MNHVVIMAGGVGSRFWPLSTPEYPKQFIDILGTGRSLIQMTVDRFEGVAEQQNMWVVTNAAYVPIVREQLPAIPAEHILAEPAARNTAPCIAWASEAIKQVDPEANIVVTPADAVVMQPEEFRRVIANALSFTASRKAIVTIGIKPNRPETGYGYIHVQRDNVQSTKEPGTRNQEQGLEIVPVVQFKEKPNLEIAKEYLAAGNYLWNAGIFVWNVQTISECLQTYKPEIAEKIGEMMKSGKVTEIFPTIEKVSIDYAVMEPASKEGLVYTHPADFGWSDLGNWQSLHEKLDAPVGNVTMIECNDCVVHCEDAEEVLIQGLEGYIVSLKNGRLLIAKRSEEQRIKEWRA